jgi:uncharacterized protein YraI
MRDTTLHAGPQGNYPTVGSVRGRERVVINGCLNDRSWCDVSRGNDRGWADGRQLGIGYGGRMQGIGNLPPNSGIGTLNFSIGQYWDDNYRQRPFYDDRNRWEQQYFSGYQAAWGPRPPAGHWGNRSTTGYLIRWSAMHSGPNFGYPRLRRLAINSQVRIYGCLQGWSWCDVSQRFDRGWVPGRDLAAQYQGRRQRIGLIAPYMGIGVLSFQFRNYWDQHYQSRNFYNQRDRWERQYVRNDRRNDRIEDREQRREDREEWREDQREERQENRRDNRGNDPRNDPRNHQGPDPLTGG